MAAERRARDDALCPNRDGWALPASGTLTTVLYKPSLCSLQLQVTKGNGADRVLLLTAEAEVIAIEEEEEEEVVQEGTLPQSSSEVLYDLPRRSAGGPGAAGGRQGRQSKRPRGILDGLRCDSHPAHCCMPCSHVTSQSLVDCYRS